MTARCYEFAGLALLTPEWIGALAALIGTIALLIGAIAAERIRRGQSRREAFERGERSQLLMLQVLWRIRTVQEDCEIADQLLSDFMQTDGPPAGPFILTLDHVLARLVGLEFSEAEAAAMGPQRAVHLLDIKQRSERAAHIVRGCLVVTRQLTHLAPVDESGLRRITIAVDSVRSFGRSAAECYSRVSLAPAPEAQVL